MAISCKVVKLVHVYAVPLVRQYVVEECLLPSAYPIEPHRSIARVSQYQFLDKMDIVSSQIMSLENR